MPYSRDSMGLQAPTMIAFAIVFVFACEARASILIVPDDHPTVQGAIDAGADTVEVRDGVYPDSIHVSRRLAILPAPNASEYSPDAYPTLGPMEIGEPPTAHEEVGVTGMRMGGAVRVPSGPTDKLRVRLTACRLDSGLAGAGLSAYSQVRIHGCLIYGDVELGNCYYVDFTGNTVVAGALRNHGDGISQIEANLFLGPGEAAMVIGGHSISVFGNAIDGFQDGIVILWGDPYVSNNTIEDCAGSGVVWQSQLYDPSVPYAVENLIRRCGGYGMIATGYYGLFDVEGNRIEDVGADGIYVNGGYLVKSIIGNVVLRAGGYGIRARSGAFDCRGNRIIAADSTGLDLQSVGTLAGNIVGHCGGDGAVIEDATDHFACLSNTVYSNGGDGLRVGSVGQVYGPGDSVSLNIAYGNGGHGLAWPEGAPAPVLSCNDWYGNEGGATGGVGVGATDLGLAPLFCDVAHDEVTLASDSPLLAAAGCGLIGAQGQGCGVRTGTPGAEGAAVAFAAWPRPARAGVTFAWAPSAGPVRVEVYDVLGARRAVLEAEAGSSGMKWDGCGRDGARLAPGVYFARLSRLEGSGVTRVVLVR